jgi:hypothetical protein
VIGTSSELTNIRPAPASQLRSPAVVRLAPLATKHSIGV